MVPHPDNEKKYAEIKHNEFMKNLNDMAILINELKKMREHSLVHSMSEVVNAIQASFISTQRIPNGAKELLKAMSDVGSFLQNPPKKGGPSLKEVKASVAHAEATVNNSSTIDSTSQAAGWNFLKFAATAMVFCDVLSNDPSDMVNFPNDLNLFELVCNEIDERQSNTKMKTSVHEFKAEVQQIIHNGVPDTPPSNTPSDGSVAKPSRNG